MDGCVRLELNCSFQILCPEQGKQKKRKGLGWGPGERRGDAPFPEEEAAVAWQPALLACKSSHTRNAMQ